MIELLLLRHAKSDWGDNQPDDAARPLAPRGEKAADAMGRRIAETRLVPDLVLCSPARRARQTWDLIAPHLPAGLPCRIVEDIYDFGDGSRLLDVIRAEGGSARRLMLVGHNPSMENLAKRLVATGDPQLRRRMAEKYPAAALAVIGIDIARWSDLEAGGGRLLQFIRPRDLAA